jgi:integral membrane protein (TIGR00529 family)
MYPLIAIILALTLLGILLHLKLRLGYSMILSALSLAVLLRVTPHAFFRVVIDEWHSKPLGQTTGYLFVTLTALVLLVNVLGIAMKHTGISDRLAPALQGVFKSRRFAMAMIPMMMGMLPTPGGIMLSAPMVRDLGDHIGVGRTRLAAINFHFRHQMETVWPLFPSVPLIQGMLGISAFTLISHNIAIMAGGLLGGVIFLLLSGIPPKNKDAQPNGRFITNIQSFIGALWPIALVIGLYAGFNLSPAIGILLAIIAFLIFHKVPPRQCTAMFKSGFEFDIILLILGALLFKLDIEAGNAIPAVVQFLSDIHVPVNVLIFFLPLLVAFLTGVTMPTVAITFPFLIPFIGTGQDTKIGLEVLAFSGLVCGLLLTPIHLCLALSATYFEAPLMKLIVKLLAPTAFIAAAGFLMAALCG